MDLSQRDAMLRLNLTPGLGPTLIRRCLEAIGSAQAVLGASVHELREIEGVGAKRAEELRRAMDTLSDGKALAREKELIEEQGVKVSMVSDAGYPRLLRLIPDPPPLLYIRGELREDDGLALAVVGTRHCTAYGRQQADRLATLCAQAGLCIVSGGARGIDAAAHRAAMRIGGRTIAVLGSGLARPYPSEHNDLFDDISGKPGTHGGFGAVVSELPMDTPPIAENFPRRNRIISGLALGVLVVEAPVRSGAMITARLAAEEHGREAMAVPGRADSPASAGCHRMVREGWGTLVTSAAETLDTLHEAGQLLKAGLTICPDQCDETKPGLWQKHLTENQRRVIAALDEPRGLDQLVTTTGLSVPALQADLTLLEVRGLVRREHGQYVRRSG